MNVSNIDGVELATPMLMHQFIGKDAETGKDVPHIIYGIKMDEMKRAQALVEGGGKILCR